MDDVAAAVARHWAPKADIDAIEAQLRRTGRDPSRPTLEDLAVVDQLHAGQLDATRRLAEWAGVPAGARVLDVGAGLGGAARLLAAEHGCTVTALELCPELDRTARVLTARLGLADKVLHERGDVREIDLGGEHDLVWLQHLDMHVADKAALYARCRAALAPGRGRVLWHDWLAGPGGPPRYPLPWSRDGSISFLVPEAGFRAALGEAGLALTRLEAIPATTRAWFDASRRRLSRVLRKADAVGRERLEALLEEVEGVLESLDGDRLVPFFGEARAAPLR